MLQKIEAHTKEELSRAIEKLMSNRAMSNRAVVLDTAISERTVRYLKTGFINPTSNTIMQLVLSLKCNLTFTFRGTFILEYDNDVLKDIPTHKSED